jgi:hypothetical protein
MKIYELDIEREELQRAINQIQQLERIVQILNKNNKSLDVSNGALL